jgi:hypothetical protein
MDNEQRPVGTRKQDLASVRGPALRRIVMGVRQAVGSDLMQTGAVGVLYEQGAALVAGVWIGSWLRPHEDELPSIRRVVARDVAPAELAFWRVGVDGEPREVASVGGADGIDAVQRGVALEPDDLAEKSGAVGRPGPAPHVRVLRETGDV